MSDVFTRSFALGGFDLIEDGRTVRGRMVPYEEPATIVELDKKTGEPIEYREVFSEVSLSKMLAGAHARGGDFRFVRLNLDHRHSFDHRIGFATSIESQGDGAWGTFRLYRSNDLDKVQSMLTESHRGLSIEFVSTRSRRREDGSIERLGVHIGEVAATPAPNYAGALITSIREGTLESFAGDDFTGGTPLLDELRAWQASRQHA
jgi:hypothetical protein